MDKQFRFDHLAVREVTGSEQGKIPYTSKNNKLPKKTKNS